MLSARLAEPDAADGFLLDGYPRTVPQVEFLDEVLAGQGVELDRVILLTVDVEEVVGRLMRRAAADGRTDDSESVIRHRLDLFAQQTAPLAALYEERGILVRVDGMGRVDEVSARVLAVATDDEQDMSEGGGATTAFDGATERA
jgi:adenylate kinase